MGYTRLMGELVKICPQCAAPMTPFTVVANGSRVQAHLCEKCRFVEGWKLGSRDDLERMRERHRHLAALEVAFPHLDNTQLGELIGVSAGQITAIRQLPQYRRYLAKLRRSLEHELVFRRVREIEEARKDEKLSRHRLRKLAVEGEERTQVASAKALLDHSLKRRQALGDMPKEPEVPTTVKVGTLNVLNLSPSEKIERILQAVTAEEGVATK